MTKIFYDSKEIYNLLNSIQPENLIKFIPTMGCLHNGHLSLIKKATRIDGKTIVSLFINPLQFNDLLDYKNYPKNIKEDIKLIKNLGVDYLFIPSQKKFLNKLSCRIQVGNISKFLCGENRPGHFEGVAIIIIKFLNLIKPNYIFLGQKDFQQIQVIKKIINDLSINTKVITCQTVRNKNGLALSSRNKNLNAHEMLIAPLLYQTLIKIKKKLISDELNEKTIKSLASNLIKKGFTKINYLEIRKEKDLEKLSDTPEKSRVFISANLGQTKLIDNLGLGKIKLIKEKFLKG